MPLTPLSIVSRPSDIRLKLNPGFNCMTVVTYAPRRPDVRKRPHPVKADTFLVPLIAVILFAGMMTGSRTVGLGPDLPGRRYAVHSSVYLCVFFLCGCEDGASSR